MKPEITQITTACRLQVNPGQQVELTHRQAAERLTRLRDLGRHSRDRGLYDVVEPIEFKAGETIGIVGMTRVQSQSVAAEPAAEKTQVRKQKKAKPAQSDDDDTNPCPAAGEAVISTTPAE